ncbi:MAG: winged helix-turn-helix domain-containing protein [Acidobacteria bacterium]|nr:winged helix-turn-helix domain-containing protein [Acidobacteriota bacterium]
MLDPTPHESAIAEAPKIFRFDDFTLDLEQRRLLKGSSEVPLTPKAFEVLSVFVAQPDKIIKKDFLLETIWPDTYVSESTLTQNVYQLRKALGQLDGGEYIETIPKFGYRFRARFHDLPKIERNGHSIVVNANGHSRERDHEPEINSGSPPNQSSWIRRWPYAIGALLLATVLAGLFWYSFTGRGQNVSFEHFSVSALTADGSTHKVAVSRDGKYLALVKQNRGMRSIVLQLLDSATTSEILPPQEKYFIGLAFSVDEKYLYYVTYDPPPPASYALRGALFRIPTFGGSPELVCTDVESPIAFSSDRRSFAFIRLSPDEKATNLMVAQVDGSSDATMIASHPSDAPYGKGGLAFSPDNESIVLGARRSDGSFQLLAVKIKTGAETPLSDFTWRWIGQPQWIDDANILVTGIGQGALQKEGVWKVPTSGAPVRLVATGVSSTLGLTVSDKPRKLIAIKTRRISSFWVGDRESLQSPTRILEFVTEDSIVPPGLSWTPDGRLLYAAAVNGDLDIWRMNLDGSQKKQLTFSPSRDSFPLATPDGKYLVFMSDRSGNGNLWKADADGSNPVQLTNEKGVTSPSITADGRFLYFVAVNGPSNYTLKRILLESGEQQTLLTAAILAPQISPDGTKIACFYPRDSGRPADQRSYRLTILDVPSMGVLKTSDLTLQGSNNGVVVWTGPDDLVYAYGDSKVTQLWALSLKDMHTQLLNESPPDPIWGMAWRPGGNQLAIEKMVVANDAVLLTPAPEAQTSEP